MKPAKLTLEVSDSKADFTELTRKDILISHEVLLETPDNTQIRAKCKQLELLKTTKHKVNLGLFVVIPRPFDTLDVSTAKIKNLEKMTIARTNYTDMIKLIKIEQT